MRIRLRLLGLATLALLGIYWTLTWQIAAAQKTYTDQTYTRQTQSFRSPWQKIDDIAKLENPADGNSVSALVEAILDYPHTFSLRLPVMREIVESRLVQSEMNYRLGRNPGIKESTVVEIGNTLADKLKLPESAHITVHQVEVLRLGMELSMPSFMGNAAPEIEKVGAHPEASELSPAQATQILLVLIDQKIINPEYQLSPEEWEKTKYQPEMDRLLQYKKLKDSGELAKTKPHAVLTAYASKDELRTQISKAVSEMSLTDGLDLVNQVFSMAGFSK